VYRGGGKLSVFDPWLLGVIVHYRNRPETAALLRAGADSARREEVTEMDVRHFGTVAAPRRGGFVIDGDDGCGAYIEPAEAARVGLVLHVGDRVEYSLRLGGAAHDVMLLAYSGSRHRVASP
jgi:hypothetical protein